jgi:Na+/H+ antiporter NhaD/arsenite permease-like protein
MRTAPRLAFLWLLFFPSLLRANETQAKAAPTLDLAHHPVGYFAILVTVLCYVAAMAEDVIDLPKSKPMVLGSVLIRFAICLVYAWHGQAKTASLAFESNLLAYVELLLFILVSVTYLNAMEDSGVFEVLKVWQLNRQYSYRQLFWVIPVFWHFCFPPSLAGYQSPC